MRTWGSKPTTGDPTIDQANEAIKFSLGSALRWHTPGQLRGKKENVRRIISGVQHFSQRALQEHFDREIWMDDRGSNRRRVQ
jgi:hypothetical protein